MTGTFENIKINDTLETAEKTAIEWLEKLDDATLIKALQDESINVVISKTGDAEKMKDMKMADIIAAFDTFVTIDATTDPKKLTMSYKANTTAPEWIKNIVDDKTPKGNDLAFLINAIYINLTEWSTTAEELFTVETKTRLAGLKKEIEKSSTASTGETTIPTLDLSKLDDNKIYFTDETITPLLKSTIEWYTWGNQNVEKQVFEYLNAWEIAKLQEYLYKQNVANGTTDQMNSRNGKTWDGILGEWTLDGMKNAAKIEDGKELSEDELKEKKNPTAIIASVVSQGKDTNDGAKTPEKKETTEITKLTKAEIVEDPAAHHLIGPDFDGHYYPMPGYDWVDPAADSENFSVIETPKITETEIAEDPAKYNLVRSESKGEYTPADGYAWRNNDEGDYTVIENEYEQKTKSISELSKIAVGIKTLTDTEKKALSRYDLMIIYSMNKKFDIWASKPANTLSAKVETTDPRREKVYIEEQLAPYKLKLSDDQLKSVAKLIKQADYDSSYGESLGVYFIITEGIIDIYFDKDTYDDKVAAIKEQKRLTKIATIKSKLPTAKDLMEDMGEAFESKLLPKVVFDDAKQFESFIIGVGKLIDTFAYRFDTDTPFYTSEKWNIYMSGGYSYPDVWFSSTVQNQINAVKTKYPDATIPTMKEIKANIKADNPNAKFWINKWAKVTIEKDFLEDSSIPELKNIEDFRWSSESNKEATIQITKYLNSLACWKVAE